MSGEKEKTPSSIATGGAGTIFEQHVGAYFLSLLITRAIPPIAKEGQIDEVSFQNKRLGWNTDDLLLVASNNAGEEVKLLLQVKRQFTISSKNSEAEKTFIDFWKDYNNKDKFCVHVDKLSLVVLRGTSTLLQHFNSLLDHARASASGEDFYARLSEDGFVSKVARKHEAEIRKILEQEENRQLSNDEIREFLSHIYVISLDLNTATSNDEVIIKSLLALTSSLSDRSEAADKSWSELLQLVGSEDGGMSVSASYRYETIPQSIRNRHTVSVSTEPIRILQEHGKLVMDSIVDTIAGSIKINRDDLSDRLIQSVNQNQITVISSAAGSGKSAAAKMLYRFYSGNAVCLAFQAVEFGVVHLDSSLKALGLNVNSMQLISMLSRQSNVSIFIESAERLLETSVRDAFSQLVKTVSCFPNIKLVITCRDYSLLTVESSILSQHGIGYNVVAVPALTDIQLEEVAKQDKNIAKAITSKQLRDLLRTPFFLNKAANMNWSDSGEIERIDEIAFRKKCWKEVICARGDGIPANSRIREQAFINIAVSRAKALSPYVNCEDIDNVALQSLIDDGLVVCDQNSSLMCATSHDVLEDWSVIQWIENEFQKCAGVPEVLCGVLGGLPALRRGFRKWLGEKINEAPDVGDEFVISVLRGKDVPDYFRDDTIVCVLLSSSVDNFLDRQIGTLLCNQLELFIRFIHLLRVSCKQLPFWIKQGVHLPSSMLVPRGNAWAAIVSMVHKNLEKFLPQNSILVLGLLEDWSGFVSWNNPEPAGFEDAGSISFKLLEQMKGYSHDESRKKLLNIIAKIPKSNAEAFLDLITRASKRDRSDDAAHDFAEIILPSVNGYFCCRDYPDEMISLTKSTYYLSEEDIERARGGDHFSSGGDIDEHFGIRHYALNKDFYPASAMRGPFKALLQYHPLIGIDFIIDLANHACSWYGERNWPIYPLEEPWKINLNLPGVGSIEQWASARLWGAYRGLSVNPHIVETALMALEEWLLLICDSESVDVEGWLTSILKRSNNVAISAVVASVSIAYPDKAGKAGLAVLSSRDLIDMDRSRIVHERGGDGMNIFPRFDTESKIYDEERKKSNDLAHRKYDLEELAVRLQFTEHRESVWELIDAYRAELPKASDQDENQKIWSLALHRMDMRGYEQDKSVSEDDLPEEMKNRGLAYYRPGKLEPEIQKVVDDHVPVREKQNTGYGLINWSRELWDNGNSDKADISDWENMLKQAKEWKFEDAADEDYLSRGVGFVAAVCVRDVWDEMGAEDREWCVATLKEELAKNSNSEDMQVRVSKGLLWSDRPAAFILPKVADSSNELFEYVAIGLTHAVQEVPMYAAEGVGKYYKDNAEAVMLVAGAIALRARLQNEIREEEARKPYMDRSERKKDYREIDLSVRDMMSKGNVNSEKELKGLNLKSWEGRDAAQLILRILTHNSDSLSVEFCRTVVDHLVEEWTAKEEDSGYRQHYEFEQFCRDRIANFVLTIKSDDALYVCERLFEAVEVSPENVAKFLDSLISAEDGRNETTSFWIIWQRFADAFLAATWLEFVDRRHHQGQEMLNRLFLASFWKEGVNHWQRLEGNAYRLDQLIEKLHGSTSALQAYIRCLYDIGDQSLPNGYKIIVSQLQPEIAINSDTLYCLEVLLNRHIFGEPARLKSNAEIQQAVISILDYLVENGSSSAYRMRDDFITPLLVNP